jgi:hypothetical protein
MQPLSGVDRTTDEHRRVKIELRFHAFRLASVSCWRPCRPATRRCPRLSFGCSGGKRSAGWVYPPIWPVMQFGNGLATATVALRCCAPDPAGFRPGSWRDVGGPARQGGERRRSRHRPPELLSGVHIHGGLAAGNGLPSGQAALAFALSTRPSPSSSPASTRGARSLVAGTDLAEVLARRCVQAEMAAVRKHHRRCWRGDLRDRDPCTHG